MSAYPTKKCPKNLTDGEKIALGIFQDWNQDEVTDRALARRYGYELINRLREAGVMCDKTSPARASLGAGPNIKGFLGPGFKA